MSIVAGVFSETLIQNVRVEAAMAMLDDRIKQQYIPHVQLLNGVKAVDTSNVDVWYNRAKKMYSVDVEFINTCDMAVADNVNCTVGGTKASTNVKTYDLNYEKVVNFTLSESDLYKNDFTIEQVLAKQFMRAKKLLLESYTQYIVAVMNAEKGVNTLNEVGGKGVISGTDTYIAANYWNADLLAYFSRVAIDNDFTNPAFFSGKNLYEQYLIANKNQGNSNGVGEWSMFAELNPFFDLKNIDTVNTPLNVSYLVSSGAIALANFAYYGAREDHKDFSAWQDTAAEFGFPEIKFDVFMKDNCENDKVKWDFKVKLSGGVYVNPEGCDQNNSGILRFVCGTV